MSYTEVNRFHGESGPWQIQNTSLGTRLVNTQRSGCLSLTLQVSTANWILYWKIWEWLDYVCFPCRANVNAIQWAGSALPAAAAGQGGGWTQSTSRTVFPGLLFLCSQRLLWGNVEPCVQYSWVQYTWLIYNETCTLFPPVHVYMYATMHMDTLRHWLYDKSSVPRNCTAVHSHF